MNFRCVMILAMWGGGVSWSDGWKSRRRERHKEIWKLLWMINELSRFDGQRNAVLERQFSSSARLRCSPEMRHRRAGRFGEFARTSKYQLSATRSRSFPRGGEDHNEGMIGFSAFAVTERSNFARSLTHSLRIRSEEKEFESNEVGKLDTND